MGEALRITSVVGDCAAIASGLIHPHNRCVASQVTADIIPLVDVIQRMSRCNGINGYGNDTRGDLDTGGALMHNTKLTYEKSQ